VRRHKVPRDLPPKLANATVISTVPTRRKAEQLHHAADMPTCPWPHAAGICRKS